MEERERADREKWQELYATGRRGDRPPSSWIAKTLVRLPNELPLVDLAGGTGRHAAVAAALGFRVVLVDIVEPAVRRARANAPGIAAAVAAASALPLRRGAFGTVVVSNFVNRDLFPDIAALLAPGGHLVYETYSVAHLDLVRAGLATGPTSLEFLMQPGELRRLASGLEVIEEEDSEMNDDAGRRFTVRLLARRP